MSLYIENKYALLIGAKLVNFKFKNKNLYNFRCPKCGDSVKHKNKSRGYFYAKKNDMFFRCHNCNMGTTLGNFIKDLDPFLYQQYVMERWKQGENGYSNYKKPDETEVYKDILKRPKFKEKTWDQLIKIPSISQLNSDHPAKIYLEGRKIPTKFFGEIFYAENFSEFSDELSGKSNNLLPEPRIVFPFINSSGNLIAVQGRAINKSSLRYITIKIKDEPKIYGQHRIDESKPVYVVEGPIDSLFIPNCIAIAGSEFNKNILSKNNIVIFDNEPRNKEIVKSVKFIIGLGIPVCIFPKNFEFKDINEMILGGMEESEILTFIDKHTHKDKLKALMAFAQWKL